MPPLIARGAGKKTQTAHASNASSKNRASDASSKEFINIRGIQNARATTAESRFKRLANDRLTSEQLLTKPQKNTNARIEKSGTQGFEEIESTNSTTSKRVPLQENTQSIQKKKRKKTMSIGAMGLAIAYTSYGWQCIFGILSLVGYVSAGGIQSSFWTSWIDIFVDFSGGLEMVGFVFWGISALIVVMTFLIFLLWFRFIGINPFHSVMSTFITILALTLSILPVTNLIPSLIFWIIYLNLTSLSSST